MAVHGEVVIHRERNDEEREQSNSVEARIQHGARASHIQYESDRVPSVGPQRDGLWESLPVAQGAGGHVCSVIVRCEYQESHRLAS